MHDITMTLPYDINVGDFEPQAIEALSEVSRLVGEEAAQGSKPALRIRSLMDSEWGVMWSDQTITLPEPETLATFLEWVVDAVDGHAPEGAYNVEIEVRFTVDLDTALLVKASWPSELPALSVSEHK